MRANTAFLARQLYDRTGERVKALPVILLPGWWVDTTVPNADVVVCNPLNLWKWLSERTEPELDPAQRRRIASFLREKGKDGE